MHDITSFLTFASSRPANRETILAYKTHLLEQAYAPASVNSMLAALNIPMEVLQEAVEILKVACSG